MGLRSSATAHRDAEFPEETHKLLLDGEQDCETMGSTSIAEYPEDSHSVLREGEIVPCKPKIIYIEAIQIQLNLVDGHIKYKKWGDIQRCKKNDWLVRKISKPETETETEPQTYTVDNSQFHKLYERVRSGLYKKKSSAVFLAWQAKEDGVQTTMENKSKYKKGDFILTHSSCGKSCCGLFDKSWPVPEREFLKSYEIIRSDPGDEEDEGFERDKAEAIQEMNKRMENEAQCVRIYLLLYWVLIIISISAVAIVPILVSLGNTQEANIAKAVAGIIISISFSVLSITDFGRRAERKASARFLLDQETSSFRAGVFEYRYLGDDALAFYRRRCLEVLGDANTAGS